MLKSKKEGKKGKSRNGVLITLKITHYLKSTTRN
jgi:hypothetical protein